MSAAPMPPLFLVPKSSAEPKRVLTMPSRAVAASSAQVRRRPSRQQGQGLEILGHALEYLVDSRMFLSKERKTRADGEAIHILSSCSREIFAACPEVVPMGQRIRAWVAEHLQVGQLQPDGRKV